MPEMKLNYAKGYMGGGVYQNYDPNQPRDPKGTSTGGQWTSGGGTSSTRPEPRRFESLDEINKWQEDNVSSLFPADITDTERATLDHYKRLSYYYKPMNEYLRRGKPEDDDYGLWEDKKGLLHGVDIIDGAVMKGKLPEDTVVYRGMASEILGAKAEGMEFVDRGFGSTSLDIKTAHKFARWTREDGFTPAVLEIRVPKGYNALAMEQLWDSDEEEILLKRNTTYRVIRDYTKAFGNDNIRFLEVEVIP